MSNHKFVLAASIIWGTSLLGFTQSVTSKTSDFSVIERGAHHKVWERIEDDPGPDGKPFSRKHAYTELATGMHFKNERGEWEESKEEIEILPNNAGAIASKGQHKAIFPPEIKSGLIELQTPDQKWMRSRVWGLAYFDAATGESVLLAEVKESDGQLVGDNVVIYPNAFTDFLADIRYTYTRAGFEQDVVLREQPPKPEEFGLDPRTTRLQVLTEFVEAPPPAKERRVMGDLADESLGFGEMSIGAGKAFSVDAEGGRAGDAAVSKQWEQIEGLDFLIEQVPFEKVSEQLQKLPEAKKYQGASLQRRGKGESTLAGLKQLMPKRYAKTAPRPSPKRMAKVTPQSSPSFVMDYIALTSQPNFTFQGDTTYYVSGTVGLTGTTTIEGGTVVKYANSSTATISVNGDLVCKTGPYRMAVFTSKDDNSVGEAIPGSSGNPTSTVATYLHVGSSSTDLRYLRFLYAGIGIKQWAASSPWSGVPIWHCQFVQCQNALLAGAYYDGYFQQALYNVLISQCTVGLYNPGADAEYDYYKGHVGLSGEHLTVDQLQTLLYTHGNTDYYPYLYTSLKNSILTGVQYQIRRPEGDAELNDESEWILMPPSENIPMDHCVVEPTGAGIYQTIGAGSYYLAADNTSCRNAGAVPSGWSLQGGYLSNALKTKTTYAPANPPTANPGGTTWPITAQRDTDTPDLGYHYDPLDYLVSSYAVNGAAHTLAAGVAVGLYGSSGFILQGGDGIVSRGRPTALNHIAWYPAVQEQPVRLNNISTAGSIVFNIGSSPGSPKIINLSFTELDMMGKRQSFMGWAVSCNAPQVTLRDCQLRGVSMLVSEESGNCMSSAFVNLANNLLERCTVQLFNGWCSYYSVLNPLAVTLYNNTFWSNTVTLTYKDQYTSWRPQWTIKDNLLDGCEVSFSGDGSYLNQDRVARSNNGYFNTTPGQLSGSGDVPLTALYYASTTLGLGPWYINTATTTPSLVNVGSRAAGLAGLYHHTIKTGQIKEGDEPPGTVDIGYHYVAVNGSGQPIDTDGDGLADYAEDKNGNGGYDTGDAGDFLNVDSDGDGLPDSWEVQNGLNPLDPADASDDPDGDWLTNLQEYNGGTNSSNPHDWMVVAWGKNTAGECSVPLNLRNVVAVAAGYDFSLALRKDGSVVAWGNNTYGQTTVPALLTNAISLSASWQQAGAVKADGSVAVWGATAGSVPVDLTNAAGIAVGQYHGLGLRSNGVMAAWGGSPNGETNVPPSVTNALQVTAGWSHSAALLSDRTVKAWGANFSEWGWNVTNPPPGLSNAKSIAAGGYHTLALKLDGTVMAWGAGNQTNVTAFADHGQSIIPAGLTNVVAIAAGGYRSLALRADGTLAAWGYNLFGQSSIPAGLTNIIGMAAGADHTLALRNGRQLPVMVQGPANQVALPGTNVTFTSLALGLAGVKYQWQFSGTNITGQTNAALTLNNVSTNNEGGYTVVFSTGAGSITSSVATLALVGPPVITNMIPTAPGTNYLVSGLPQLFGMTVNATALATDRYPLRYQWFTNGVAIPSATNASYYIFQYSLPWVPLWQTNPANADYFVKVWNPVGTNQSATWTVRVVTTNRPGSVLAWGENSQAESEYLTNLTDVIAVAAGVSHSLALRESGVVVGWGSGYFGQTNAPSGLTNAVGIAAGWDHSLAVRADGTVVGWGYNNHGQTTIPSGLTNAIAVSAGGDQSLALRKDGSVMQWGRTYAAAPALTSATAIASGDDFHVALLTNGTVVAWGDDFYGQTEIPSGLNNVVAIAAGGSHALALRDDGTVIGWGDNDSGQLDAPTDLTNAMAIATGWNFSLAVRNDGSVVAWGDDATGQTSVPTSLQNVKGIAAGGEHGLANIFSPLVQYPVDVTKDLLLIYNTNSINSIVVKDYYLAHRPMVVGANVLGIDCTTNETIDIATFTNQILPQYLAWLNDNPTKRPQYIILFPDLPTRIWETLTCTNYCRLMSVAFGMHANFPGIKPFVTSINMGLTNPTNDCIAYINKVRDFGTNYSPGQLFISASQGGYGNTNYVVDNVRHGSGYSPSYTPWGAYVFNATNGLSEAGVLPGEISYLAGNETRETNELGGWFYHDLPHITNAVNVAGYISWGSHSSLGNEYPRFGPIRVKWTGNSAWWVIETIESFNGWRHTGQGNFTQWFSADAFGGTDYSNTPIGAVSHTDEPGLAGVNDSRLYFGLWAQGKSFAISGWNSRITPLFQAVGDPFTTK